MKNKHNIPLFTRKALATAITSIYMSAACLPAYASDTEIYTQTTTSASASPTVMMVIDTSGSMEECIDSSSGYVCSDSAKKRINVLRSALTTVLLGKTGATAADTILPAPGFVKMGYARFNPDANKGGWVRYPARPLDALVEISPDGFINSYGSTGMSDTEQTSSLVNNNTATKLTVGVGSAVGVLFNNVMLPKGASITEAYIEFTASDNDNSSAEWRISVEQSPNPVDYTSSTATALVNGRTYSSTDLTYAPEAWVAGTKYQVPITALAQKAADQSAWCGGNNMNFKIVNKETTSTAQRRAHSNDSTTSGAKPRLFIRYTVDPNKTDSCIKITRTSTFTPKASSDDAYYYDSWTSLDTTDSSLWVNYISSGSKLRNIVRFPSVGIANGSIIKSAILSGLSPSSKAVTSVKNINVEIFNADNVTSFCSGSSCPKPTYGVTANSPFVWPLTTIPKSADGRVNFDVKDLVQSVVNRSGWASNNALGFRLANATTTTNDSARFATVDNSLSSAMNLSVTWEEQVTDLTKFTTVREDILADLNFLDVSGGTPLGAAYAEASRYMLGMAPYVKDGTADFGGGEVYAVHDPRTLTADKSKFVSPVNASDSCSGNYIFMMSDGEPNNLANANVNTKGITGASCSNEAAAAGSGKQLNWYCMFDLAAWNMKSVKPTGQVSQAVHTTTVYYGPISSTNPSTNATIQDNIANMKKVADFGDGDAFQATDEAKLVEALTKTIKKAVDAGGTISAPGVAVNQLNRLNHLDQLFYAVFDPKPNTYRWDGNIKRYKLKSDGSAIIDVNNADAIDASTGFFKETSKSFWSDDVDGNKTVEGGAASKLPKPDPANTSDTDYRKMYTYLGSLSSTNQSLDPIKLGDTTFDNAAKTLMGLSSQTTVYNNLMKWYKGYQIPALDIETVVNSTSVLRERLGGALHSQPVLINYGYTGTLVDADNPDNQKNYVFVSTLEGTLHAIDAKTGEEKFSFIPGEKLADLKTRYENPSTVNPGFGMDLTWTFMRQDSDKNGQIENGDKVYLYGGMRMGGRNYYALNLTSLTSPKLLFAIQGGIASTPFARMGQTWSQPVVATMRVENTLKQVLVFGGGYDPIHETAGQLNNGTNDLGNLLYIVDALTGQLIWYASGNSSDSGALNVPDMKFSVPTAPNVVDLNGDGIADSIYFGDLGGQIFRADINNFASTKADLVKRVRLVAKLGESQSATTTNQRRFYEKPAVALFTDSSGKKFATVAQGSGYRSRPLNTVTDENFFVVFDYDLPRADLLTAEATSLQPVITKENLVALDLNSTAVQTNGVTLTTGQKGWYVDLPEVGEKNLAASLIFKNRLIFTTYSPVSSTSNTNKCTPVIGNTKMYTFCMPYGKLCSTTTSYKKDNVMVGLAGEPQLMIIPDPANTGKYKTVIITGTSVDKDIFGDVDVAPKVETLNKWREKTKKETSNETGK